MARWWRRLAAVVFCSLIPPAGVTGELPSRIVVLPDSGPVVLPLAPARAAATTTLEERIDACVRAGMSSTQAPGAAIAVMLDGQLLYQQGYGVRRLGGVDPVTADTVFRIGSVTKMMTAAAVLQQVEAGRVDLAAPVTRYVPELAINGRWPADRITVHHLLTHTSGWPDRLLDLGASGEDALSNWAEAQGDVTLHAPPGAFWNYANPNFMLAGLVLERASGVPYRTYLEQQLWGPAGMTSTTFDAARVMAGGNYATGHAWDAQEHEWVPVEPDDIDSWSGGPAGWAFSTVGDLMTWAKLMMEDGGPVLAPASAVTMQGPRVWCHYTPELHYGYGISRDRYIDRDVLYHDGSVIGWGTFILWLPEREFAVAVLANTPAPLVEASFCALDAVLPPSHPGWDPGLYARVLPPLEGRYELTDYLGRRLSGEVSIDHGFSTPRLRLEVTRGGPVIAAGTYPMNQFAASSFLVDTGASGFGLIDLTFIEGPDGRSPVRWMRYRYAVGDRLPEARPATGRRAP